MIELHLLVHMQMKHSENDKGYNLLLLLIMLSCTPSPKANKSYCHTKIKKPSVHFIIKNVFDRK